MHTAYSAGIKVLYTSEPTLKAEKYNDMQVVGRYVVHRKSATSTIMKLIQSPFYRSTRLMNRRLIVFLKTLLGGNYRIIKNYILKLISK